MTYTLRNGYNVRTAKLTDGRTEFVTANPAGEIISTVVCGPVGARARVVELVKAQRHG